jgi:hypothetical protein
MLSSGGPGADLVHLRRDLRAQLSDLPERDGEAFRQDDDLLLGLHGACEEAAVLVHQLNHPARIIAPRRAAHRWSLRRMRGHSPPAGAARSARTIRWRRSYGSCQSSCGTVVRLRAGNQTDPLPRAYPP